MVAHWLASAARQWRVSITSTTPGAQIESGRNRRVEGVGSYREHGRPAGGDVREGPLLRLLLDQFWVG
jgi:hypothetical protein